MSALDGFKMPHRALAIDYVWSMYGRARGSSDGEDQPINRSARLALDDWTGCTEHRADGHVVCEGDCNGEPWMLAVLRMAWVISYSNSGMIRPGLLEIATTTAPKRIRHFSSFSALLLPGVYICIPPALPSIFAPSQPPEWPSPSQSVGRPGCCICGPRRRLSSRRSGPRLLRCVP